MPLIKCSDCGRDISDEALFCPQCGRLDRTATVSTNDEHLGPALLISGLLLLIFEPLRGMAFALLIVGLALLILRPRKAKTQLPDKSN
jgi:uncharacterized membrane protein YvbJ